MSNGILSVSLSVPDGLVTGISYQGINNLLETKNPENDRGCVLFTYSKESLALLLLQIS